MANCESFRKEEELVDILKAAIYIHTCVNLKERTDIEMIALVNTVQELGAETQFEKCVVVIMEFFRSHNFKIAMNTTILSLLDPDAAPEIPQLWRDFITILSPESQSCVFYLQIHDQIFHVLISRLLQTVMINVQHLTSRKIFPAAFDLHLFDELSHEGRKLVFANWVYDSLKASFKTMIDKALKNETPTLSRNAYRLTPPAGAGANQ